MIHLVGLPHTEFDDVRYSSCAFTAKAVRLARMLRSTGREVTVYWGGAGDDIVSVMSPEEQLEHFGPYSPDALPVVVWHADLKYWVDFNQRVTEEITKRIEPQDIVAVVGGPISQSVIDNFKATHTCVEPGVGYEGLSMDTFACFESYAWMHNRYEIGRAHV